MNEGSAPNEASPSRLARPSARTAFTTANPRLPVVPINDGLANEFAFAEATACP